MEARQGSGRIINPSKRKELQKPSQTGEKSSKVSKVLGQETSKSKKRNCLIVIKLESWIFVILLSQ